MRRVPEILLAAALACAALLVPGAPARAEETMTFHPVPAESAAQIARDARRTAQDVRTQVRDAVRAGKLRSVTLSDKGVSVTLDSTNSGATLDVPTPPEAPETADVPDAETRAHETTGEILRFGTDIVVRRSQAVQGDVVSIGGSVRVYGLVRGSVTSMGGDVSLMPGSRVDGDVVCMGGTLHEEPGSSVGGQRVTAPRWGGNRLFMPMLAVLGTSFQVINHLIRLLIMIGIAFLIVKLAPGRTRRALDGIHAEPGASFLIGLLLWALIIPSVIVMALVVAILCITIIGIPLAAAVVVGYVAFFLVASIWGTIVGNAVLGAQLHQRFKGSTATLMQAAIWGTLAIYAMLVLGDLFHVVPLFGIFGGFVRFIARAIGIVLGTLGAGALVRSEYSRRTVQDWWHRSRLQNLRRGGDDIPPPPMYPPPSPVAPPGAPPAAASPVAPSAPAAFMPPAAEPPLYPPLYPPPPPPPGSEPPAPIA